MKALLSSETSLTVNQSPLRTSQKIRMFNNTALIASDLTRNFLNSRITCQLFEANWSFFYLSFRFRCRTGRVQGIRCKSESRLAKSQLTLQFQHGILERNILTSVIWSRLRLKCDGTRAETRFRLSAKWTSPFKSTGASVQSTTGSRGVRISGSNAGYTKFQGSVKGTGYPLHSRGRQFSRLLAAEVCASAVVMLGTPSSEVVWRVLATHSIRQFRLHFPFRASQCAITFQLDFTIQPVTSSWPSVADWSQC